jgi:hypothetical protein
VSDLLYLLNVFRGKEVDIARGHRILNALVHAARLFPDPEDVREPGEARGAVPVLRPAEKALKERCGAEWHDRLG